MTPARVIAGIVAVLAIAGIGLLFLFAKPARGQVPIPCAPVSEMLASITGLKYGEKPQNSGTVKTGGRLTIILIYANPETGTWSIIALPTPGMACLMWSGSDWRRAPVGDPA